jgi:hypothetical protein
MAVQILDCTLEMPFKIEIITNYEFIHLHNSLHSKEKFQHQIYFDSEASLPLLLNRACLQAEFSTYNFSYSTFSSSVTTHVKLPNPKPYPCVCVHEYGPLSLKTNRKPATGC